jgi:AraC-like DNA-binding protein
MPGSASLFAVAAAARTQVLRGPESQPWELWRRTPLPALRGMVAGLWAGRSIEPGARHRLLPNGELWLMFHLGPGQRLVERDGAPCAESMHLGFLGGMQERPFTMEAGEPDTRVVTLRLLPLGAARLLSGVPLAELTGRVLDPGDVFERSAGFPSLRQQIQDARDLGAALDVLESWLLARLRRAPPPNPVARAASLALWSRAGRVRVDAIARETGLSPRRLSELFHAEVGVPPKRYARILRFRHALDQLAAAPADADLAGAAHDCGYFDQAHLYRDFRALAQLTPREYQRVSDPHGDGPDVVPG